MTVAASPTWQELCRHRKAVGRTTLRELFADEPNRAARLTFDAAGIHADLSKSLTTEVALDALLALARERGVERLRDAMFAGERVNTTEDRAALHVALRMPRGRSLLLDGRDVVRDVHEMLDRMADLAGGIADGSIRGATGRPFRTVVNVGIGGSELGPAMAVGALRRGTGVGLSARFVANVDPAEAIEAIEGLDPAETFIVVCSKTFTTAETMANARTLRAWIVAALGEAAVADHLVAVSANTAEAERFGINAARVFEVWDWVGGRTSLASASGLSAMLALGPEAFRALLGGMHRMDEHFREAPPEHNLPLLTGLLAVWYRGCFGAQTRAVLPYDRHLARFPAYLQQLAMESNGKSVTAAGEPVGADTGPVIFGEPGTNGQHSFHQLLHQGTALVPCDFIGFCRPLYPGTEAQHDVLLANLLAQSAALAFGRTADEVRAAGGVAERLVPHRVLPGNRPSTVLLLERLDPAALGALVALYEHDVLTQAAVWGINPFDQWGVEHGKALAGPLAAALAAGAGSAAGSDPSTDALLRHVRTARTSG